MPDLRTRLQSVLNGKFRIIRELTGGGMSRVFLAEEIALEREVVVKVLAPHLVDERAVQRFRHEALQTARLQHPTIVSVFDVGEIESGDGSTVPFYIMPYVRGESLRSRLQHDGALSVTTAARVLRSVLDALVYAHTNGVVHCDIKPGNIFLSGSNAVVADFGIAKAVAGPRALASSTVPGAAVGTPAYMAPEQFLGDEKVDLRADLYSVGVVAYEMLAGKLPWVGSPFDLNARAENEIPPLHSVRPDVPPELGTSIDRCLAWDAAQRPASATEVLRVVESFTSAPLTPSSVPSVLKLPVPRRSTRRQRLLVYAIVLAAVIFGARWALQRNRDTGRGPMRLAIMYPELDAQTRGDSTLNEYVYHMLVGSLHPVLGLQLVGEVTVPAMRGRGLTADQVADSLQVDSVLVLQSSPATNGERLLQVELRERRTKRQTILAVAGPASLRSMQTLTPDSVQSLLKLLAGQVATRLGLTSTNSEASTTQKTEAWIAWSRGRDASATRSPQGMRDAIRWYKRAIALDSLYVQAQADLSTAMSNAMWYRYRTDDSPVDLAIEALRLANRAVELRPNFPDGYLARGYIGMLAGAPVEFLKLNYGEAQRLVSANPFFRTWNNGLLAAQGKLDEALARVEDEVRRDPRSPGQHITLALYALAARQYVTAVRSAREAHAMAPDIPLTASFELWGLLAMGGRTQAECAGVQPGPYLGVHALCLERTGRESDARRVVDSLARIITARAPMDSTFDLSLYLSEMAFYAAAHGDRSAADRWLREVFHQSPTGIDFRLMRSTSYFTRDMIALTDSLRRAGWQRIQRAAATAVSAGRGAP
jgi:tetratricopeptide (TPR) repeat protein